MTDTRAPFGAPFDAPLDEVAAEAARAVADLDLAEAVSAFGELNRLSRRAMLSAVLSAVSRRASATRDSGAPTDPEPTTVDAVTEALRPAPGREPLPGRWLRALAEEGLVALDGERVRFPRGLDGTDPAGDEPAWERLAERWRAVTDSAATVEYVHDNVRHLLPLLRGETPALLTLFPEGRDERARTLYRENVVTRYGNAALGAVATRLATGRERRSPLRLLEVGGGTAGTTHALLPRLARLPVDYTFSDVSPFFFDRVLTEYAAVLGPDRFHTLTFDLNRAPDEQGLAPGSFDLIVSGGALNAAVDTDAALRRLRRLLSPGGVLAVTEPTHDEDWVAVSQALLMPPPKDVRARTGAAFLDHPQWRAAWEDAGLLLVTDLPEPHHPLHPLGHRVFVGVADA
ncbi:class I SAM-dependent methyltransferase [Streptomyces sp. NPDC005438]|uniref:class I SAM-dependent methyltransferase n=1 Tax=Streptomyces sp. NPDC005438 TaxID=3156880 RepID=UPI0033A241CD